MKRLKLILSSLIVTPLLLVPVVAHAETTTTTTTETVTTETTTQRVGKYKLALKTQPTVAEQIKIKANCKAAQVKGRILSTQITQKIALRSAAYVAVTVNIDNLINDLNAANVDTTELQTESDALQKLITTYGTDLKVYQDNITDMNAVDCVADPVGFKAALEAARTSQATVLKDIKAIRAYVNDTIKPTLQAIITSNTTNGSAQ
jgi:aconitase B